MDDAKTVGFSILMSLLFLSTVAAWAAGSDIEFIGADKEQQLEKQFAEGHFDGGKDARRIQGHDWQCDMYGMRSKMQVKHGLKLYKWSSPSAEKPEMHNSGAQLVNDYKADGGALIGIHERFEDQVKLTPDGHLISQLSVISPQKMIVAYSVCTSL